jgi:eukaryotic-like serine/threonine-protein kinase
MAQGTIAGRYRVVREVGRGGMGAVWLAHDEVLDRPVALKRVGLLPGADSTDLARAEREARLAAQLSHPHVVAVFNLVVDADTDSRWLVMEYVEGSTLAQLVRDRGPLTPDEAAPLIRQVADALVAAHAVGIVHRDVKPSNILVDRHRQAKLTDFGIARVAADPALTQTGFLTGSPAYLAPEVASGERGGEPVDVWSLGATLFHVLAGRPPYDIGDNVLGGLYKVVHDEPPRLAQAGWLAPLLAGTMERDPARRWSMTQVRDFLDGRAAPTDTREVAALPNGPRRGLLAGLVALVAAAVLGFALFALLPDDEPTESASDDTTPAATTSPEPSPEPSPSETTKNPTPAGPTARGMKDFIRGYVAAISADPDTAWQMLTPKFQRESGGLDTYREFWDDATDGRVLSITADPDNLTVSYQVRFDDFDNGPGPTVLDLTFDNGRYLINGEHSKGFVPAD